MLATAVAATDPTPVTGVTLDSRRVRPGDLYAALPGANVHGARFAAQAAAAGAVAALTDPAGADLVAAAGLPALVVPDPRAVLGDLAARISGRPGRRPDHGRGHRHERQDHHRLPLESLLRAAGWTTGLLGTVETRIAGERVASVRTTPEAPDLHALLARMVERRGARLRAGGLQPRPGAAPRRRPRRRRRALHQPVTRTTWTSTASMEDVLRRQGRAVHPRPRPPRRRGWTWTTSTAGAGASPRLASVPVLTVGDRRGATGASPTCAPAAAAAPSGSAASWAARPSSWTSPARCRGTSTSPTRPWRPWPPCCSACAPATVAAGLAAAEGVPGPDAARGPRRRSRSSSSTTPTPPTPWTGCCGRCAGHRGAPRRRSSAPAGTATAASAR